MTKSKPDTKSEHLRKPAAKKLGLKINPLGMPHEVLVRPEFPNFREDSTPSTNLAAPLAEDNSGGYTTSQNPGYTDLQTQSYTNPENRIQTIENQSLKSIPTPSYTPPSTQGYTNEKVYSSVYSSENPDARRKNTEKTAFSTPSYTPIQTQIKSRQTKLVALRLNTDLIELIKGYCEKKNETFKDFMEKSAIQRLEGSAIQASNPVYSHHDDMMIITEDDNIIRAYARFAIHPWTRRDSRDARRFAGTDPKIIDIAMVLTVERKLRGNTSKIPIKSFAYFIPEIETLLDDLKNKRLPLAIDDYHRYVLDNWERKIKPLRNEKWNITETQENEASKPDSTEKL